MPKQSASQRKERPEAADGIVQEGLGFLRYLKVAHVPDWFETALLSESSLSPDWLRLEEDEAWRDLW